MGGDEWGGWGEGGRWVRWIREKGERVDESVLPQLAPPHP